MIAAFDVAGQQPVLVSQRIVPSSVFTGFENTTATGVPGNELNALPPGTVSVYDLSGGGISENDFPLLVNGAPVSSVVSATIAQGRMFAIFTQERFPAGTRGLRCSHKSAGLFSARLPPIPVES